MNGKTKEKPQKTQQKKWGNGVMQKKIRKPKHESISKSGNRKRLAFPFRNSRFQIDFGFRHSTFEFPAETGSDQPLVHHRVRDLEEAGNVCAVYVVAGRTKAFRSRATGFVNRFHDALQARLRNALVR